MAGNLKDNKKINNNNKKNNNKKNASNNNKNINKKTNSKANKKTDTKKINNNQNKINTEVKEVVLEKELNTKEEVEEKIVIEDKKEEIVENVNNKKKKKLFIFKLFKKKNKKVKKEKIKKEKNKENKPKKGIRKRIKEMSKFSKFTIIVIIICLLIMGIEGTLFIINRNKPNNNITYNDTYNGVTYDDKNVVVVGTSDFHYSKLTSKDGNTRGRIIKYDANGKVIFEKIYERGISSAFNSVISVKDGYIVCGTGIFSEEEQENEGREAILIKYDKDGEIVWEKFLHILTNTNFNKVIATSDGYIAIGQSIYANLELGNHTTGGGIIVKYDKNGKEIWRANHGGTKSGNFNDVVQVENDFYVVGKDGADCANIVKFNAKGEYQWHKNYRYTDAFGFGAIKYLNNELYVVGSKKVLPSDVTDESDRSTTNTDAVLIKYDLKGNIVFEKTFGGSSYERYNDLVIYQNNLYVVGHLCSHNAGLKNITTDDISMTGFLIRYDINGNILKKESYGGSSNDNLTKIVSDGVSLYIVGYSNSKDGNIKTSHDNGKDYFGKLIKLNSKLKVFYIK